LNVDLLSTVGILGHQIQSKGAFSRFWTVSFGSSARVSGHPKGRRRPLDRRSPAARGDAVLRSAKWQGQETLPQLGLDSTLSMAQKRLAEIPRRRRVGLAIFAILVALSAVTAWNVTRSDALLAARRSYTRGELATCLQHSLDHLRRQPWSREAALLAAHCLNRLDYAEPAEAYYQRAGVLSLSDLQIRAYGLVRGPHPERAIPVFNEILARSPENVTAMRRLAAVLLAQNQTEELLKLAERLDHTSHGAIIGSTLRGVVYHNDKNPQQSVVAFRRVLELDPQLREAPLARSLFWSHLADDLAASGRIDDARLALTEAVAKAPDSSLLNRLGRMYFLQGDLDGAERCFRESAELAPTQYEAYVELAKLAIQRHDRQEALKQLNRARDLAPREQSVLYSLVSVYRQLGRTTEADQVQETLKQLREQAAVPNRAASGAWPRYAL
jgi:tetratricopeptide (TPR) repeat protein